MQSWTCTAERFMDGIVFRPAKAQDAKLWTETRQKAWAATYRGIYPDHWIDQYDYAGHERRDRESLSDPSLHCFLVMDGSFCAGYFSYGPAATGEFYLKNLYLLPDQQGRGLGRKIMSQLRRDCARLGYQGFYCHCNQHNLPARGFYERMGGRLVSIDGGHLNKAEDQCRYNFTLTEYTKQEGE